MACPEGLQSPGSAAVTASSTMVAALTGSSLRRTMGRWAARSLGSAGTIRWRTTWAIRWRTTWLLRRAARRPTTWPRPLRQQRLDLLRHQLAPPAERQLPEPDVHDPHALQCLDRVAERLAHAADLPVEALGQHDVEQLGAELRHAAWLRRGVREPDSGRHLLDELRRDRAVDRD